MPRYGKTGAEASAEPQTRQGNRGTGFGCSNKFAAPDAGKGRGRKRENRKVQAPGRKRHDSYCEQEGDPILPSEQGLLEVYDGTIVKYDDTKGFGFIHCEELRQQLGQDVFVHEQQLNGCGCNDRVFFQLFTHKGRQQACNLMLQTGQQAVGSRDSGADADEDSSVFRGTIRKKGKDTFINCPEARGVYGQDVFVLPSKVGGFESGDPVEFTVSVNNPKGQPQAQMLNSVLPPELTMPRETWETWQGQGDLAEPGAPSYNHCNHQGTVNFDHDRGIGIIECEDLHRMYGCDTTMEKKQFASLQVGDTVRFSIRVVRACGLEHQPQAVELYRVVPES